MIQTPKYKTRSHDYLDKVVRKCQNRLDMRDWQIELTTTVSPPDCFLNFDNSDATARILYYTETLTAFIWVSQERCRKDECDPVFALKHEIGHLFLELHNEEWRASKFATLI